MSSIVKSQIAALALAVVAIGNPALPETGSASDSLGDKVAQVQEPKSNADRATTKNLKSNSAGNKIEWTYDKNGQKTNSAGNKIEWTWDKNGEKTNRAGNKIESMNDKNSAKTNAAENKIEWTYDKGAAKTQAPAARH